MAKKKVKWELAPPDDPMFSEGPQVFVPYKPKKSIRSSPKNQMKNKKEIVINGIKIRVAPPDDPMFSEGPSVFVPYKPKEPEKGLPKSKR